MNLRKSPVAIFCSTTGPTDAVNREIGHFETRKKKYEQGTEATPVVGVPLITIDLNILTMIVILPIPNNGL